MSGLCLVPMTLAAFTSPWTAFRVGGIQLVDIFLCLSAVGLVLEILSRQPLPSPPRWVLFGGAGVLLLMAVSELFPPDSAYLYTRFQIGTVLAGIVETDTGGGHDSVTKALQWVFAMLMVPMLIVFVGERSERALMLLAVAWAAGAAVSAVVALLDFVGVTDIALGLLGNVSITGRQTGLATHPNNLGVPCALAAPICIAVLKHSKFLGSAMLTALGVGALLSGSRGAQAGIVLALLLVVWISGSTSVLSYRLLVPGLLVGASLLLLLPQELVDQGRRLLRISESSASVRASNDGRLLLATQAVDDFFERPFVGVGLEWITYAHSIYLQVLSAGGVVLLAVTFVFFGGAIRAGLRLRSTGNLLVAAALASLLSWLAMGVIENQITDRYLYFTVGILAAYEVFGRRSGWLRESSPAERESTGAILESS